MIDDIFEYLRSIIHCDYISDIKYGEYRITAISVLNQINIALIQPNQYTDICQYLGI